MYHRSTVAPQHGVVQFSMAWCDDLPQNVVALHILGAKDSHDVGGIKIGSKQFLWQSHHTVPVWWR